MEIVCKCAVLHEHDITETTVQDLYINGQETYPVRLEAQGNGSGIRDGAILIYPLCFHQ